MIELGNDWDVLLREEFEKDYYKKLRHILAHEYRTQTVYPSMYDIFSALKYTPYHEVKAVILGQDPYHGPGQAHGLSFSVREGIPAPPSLQNIYREIGDEYHIDISGKSGCLTGWAKQGVLLLNTVLTVRQYQANSHRGIGWELFTDRIITLLNEREQPVVFLLWGANARAKKSLITEPRHLVLTAAHPSPLSAFNGFFGCGHFVKTNRFLKAHGMSEIDWTK